MKFIFLLFATAGLSSASLNAQAQLLNKLKQTVENRTVDAVDKALSDKIRGNQPGSNGAGSGAGATGGTGSSSSAGGRSRNQNSGGEGLVSTPPDVKAQLNDAESSFKKGSYNEARQAIQQAMLGVEMEIGQKILGALPESISSLPKDASVEQVTSTGWGWAGLTILRQYNNNNSDKEFRVTVANNAAWMSALNLYLTNGGYNQTSGGEQNWKRTKVSGHQAVIEFDEGSGYKLSVPLGQSSLIVYEGVNFKNEKEMLAAAETVNISQIKKMLGEQ